MAPPLLLLRDIALTFGGTPLLTGAELSLAPRERVCLVGRNGSGKSTLLKIAAGLVESDGGERFLQPGVTVRYLPQEPDFAGFETTLAYVEAGLTSGDDPFRARYLLGELGLTGEERTDALSGGQSRRAALARTLAPEPDILLLDEPTNHLDLPAIEWLETELAGLKSAFVLISHDRRFLERLSRETVWLDRGRTRRFPHGFGRFEAARDALLEEEEIQQQKLVAKIGREEDWMRYGVTARRKRNQRRVGELAELRRTVREHRGAVGQVRMAAAEADRSGKLVVEAKHVSKAYGRPVVRDVSTRIARGDRVGVVGANGAGKTTLVNLLLGRLAPDSGEVRLGAGLEVALLDQMRETLDPATSVKDTLTGGRSDMLTIGGQPRHVMSYLKDFLFSPEQARTPVGVLSGGERARLTLARALATPSNLLVLDEPTNDLDLETLDLLQEMLADYSGTILLVSHDRDFLDRTVSATIASEGDGRWQEYAGGYADMLLQRGAREAETVTEATPKMKAAAAGQRGRSDKLSFKDKHALEKLPETMAALNVEIARAQAALADPDLFSRDAEAFERAMAKLAAAQEKLETAEEEWLRLEMLREAAEA